MGSSSACSRENEQKMLRRRFTSTFLVAPGAEDSSFSKRMTLSFASMPSDMSPARSRAGTDFGRKASTVKRKGDLLDDITEERNPTGILVHGCHLAADGWKEIVWGNPPDELGRIPHAVMLA